MKKISETYERFEGIFATINWIFLCDQFSGNYQEVPILYLGEEGRWSIVSILPDFSYLPNWPQVLLAPYLFWNPHWCPVEAAERDSQEFLNLWYTIERWEFTYENNEWKLKVMSSYCRQNVFRSMRLLTVTRLNELMLLSRDIFIITKGGSQRPTLTRVHPNTMSRRGSGGHLMMNFQSYWQGYWYCGTGGPGYLKLMTTYTQLR